MVAGYAEVAATAAWNVYSVRYIPLPFCQRNHSVSD